MRNFYTGAILIALSLAACTQASEDLEALKSEVIKAHDRIMPRNVELIRSEAGLSDLLSSLDSLKEAKPETDTLLLRHQADSLIHNLNAADNAMSDWMYAFQVDYRSEERRVGKECVRTC